MACSRCGQKTVRRPVGGGSRPGTSYNPGRKEGGDNRTSGQPTVKDAISGLRYVPTK